MPSITGFLEWLQALPLAVFIHKTPWAFTTIQVIHLAAISLVLGTITIVDLRLLGAAFTKRPFAELSGRLLPLTWVAFAVAVIAGALMFMTRATDYVATPVFWIKMALIVLAGINMMVFELITVRSVGEWNLSQTPPPRARLAGGISIACWMAVLVLGRLIAFSLPME